MPPADTPASLARGPLPLTTGSHTFRCSPEYPFMHSKHTHLCADISLQPARRNRNKSQGAGIFGRAAGSAGVSRWFGTGRVGFTSLIRVWKHCLAHGAESRNEAR